MEKANSKMENDKLKLKIKKALGIHSKPN